MTVKQLKLLEAMAKLNFSQSEAARKARLPPRQVSAYARNHRLSFRNANIHPHHPAIADLRAYHGVPR